MQESTGLEIAVVGMAGRFPGAASIAELWHNLVEGRESISFFTPEEMEAAGVPRAVSSRPGYVPARGVLQGADLFDAGFFGMSPREAELLDPQQRLFLECAWEALEDAGCSGEGQPVGVWAGAGPSTYFLNAVLSRRDLLDALGGTQTSLVFEKDFLCTRVAYKLDLQGPAVSVQTACSTSLVAVCLACQGLLTGLCDTALAGGVSIRFPQQEGYLHQPGGTASSDGHCRAFDARSDGTIHGDGVAVVVLKRLEDAVAEGHTIQAVIRGWGLNNDGAQKVGFTAPRAAGQVRAIQAALAMAEVAPETIGYVEAHGTGTALGDPIEVSALNRAFGGRRARPRTCALGSIKTNLGHLDSAAGVAGLIKAVLAVRHGLIPPSLHFERPNPQVELEEGPFYVADRLSDWPEERMPRRAGVSSFGIGGTNAHVILEEPPEAASAGSARDRHLLVLSARTPAALAAQAERLAAHLESSPEPRLEDAAYTLLAGRRALSHRAALVCRDRDEAVRRLRSREPGRLVTGVAEGTRPVVFLFPGQGAQAPGMAGELRQREPVFRREMDRCAEILAPWIERDVWDLLDPSRTGDEEARRRLDHIPAQPVLFSVEYALARLWMHWGVTPSAMLGYSLGEYVSACLAGVFSLEDALALVAARGRLLEGLPEGAMVSVALPVWELQPLPAGLSLAAVNHPSRCVLSGPVPAVEELERRCAERGVSCRRLRTSHAYHSPMVEPILGPFADLAAGVRLQPPQLPFLSNRTGAWATAEQVTDPSYWVEQLRQPVRFADAVNLLVQGGDRLFLEVGPGRALSSAAAAVGAATVTCLDTADGGSEIEALLTAVGTLWAEGVQVDLPRLYEGEARQRVPLPTYPFERQRHFVEPRVRNETAVSGWWTPVWRPEPLAPSPRPANEPWLVIDGGSGLGDLFAERLAVPTDDVPVRVLHLGLAAPEVEPGSLVRELEALSLLQEIVVVASGALAVTSGEEIDPARVAEMAALVEWGRSRPVRIRCVDAAPLRGRQVERLLSEILSGASAERVAYRGAERWIEVPGALPAAMPALREGGVYVVDGGHGELGRELVSHLAAWRPNLVALEDSKAVARARERFGRIDGLFHVLGEARGLDLERLETEAGFVCLLSRLPLTGEAALTVDVAEALLRRHGDERFASVRWDGRADLGAALGPGGAVVRIAALPTVEDDASEPAVADSDEDAPSDELELLVAGIWRDLLGVARVGIHDNFFRLGGDSLIAVQLSARLRDALDVDVKVSDLFAEPTIAGLISRLENTVE